MLLILDSTSNSISSHTLGLSLHSAFKESRAVDRTVIEYGILSDRTALAAIISSYNPEIIVNCIEYNYIDRAEYDRETAYEVNSFAVKNLAELCRDRDTLLVNLSTSSVFSGRARVPVSESDCHDPVNVYGDSRSLGDVFIVESGCRHLTFRLPYVYGEGIPLFNQGLALMDGGGTLVVRSDQVIAPTSVDAAAAALSSLISAGATGTYHFSLGGSAYAVKFAVKALDLLYRAGRINEKFEIKEVAGDDFLAPADRPLYNVLDTKKYSAFTGLLAPRWEEALESYIMNNHESLQINGKEHG
jgi:dTDP-4-dehydrorhamnose reductase